MTRTRREHRGTTTLILPGASRPAPSEVCLELCDHSTVEHSAVKFFGTAASPDPIAHAARLADQFTVQNRRLFSLMEVEVEAQYDGNKLGLSLTSGSKVGAIPLYSPSRGTADYGLIVKPRFPWSGIGPMLADTGWKVAPSPLKLPLLRRSERRVPPWVLSHMILTKLATLLRGLDRRFETSYEVRASPRGRIDWANYVQKQISRAQFQALPCTFPDLRDDRLLKGAIRFALERQLRSLQSQTGYGAYVYRLLDTCNELLARVRDVTPSLPTRSAFEQWLQRPMRSAALVEGVQAIEWTAEERGLAGISDLEGIPWTMSMDAFFEAFVESVMGVVARRTGARLSSGRLRETLRPITWSPSFVGSQRSLVPDVWLEWSDTTLIVDAKYKRHWQELQGASWSSADELIREQHRADLFQILAYANLARTRRVISCLLYPCEAGRWQELLETKRLIHKADISAGERSLQLWLTAIPMGMTLEKIAAPIEEAFRSTIQF